MIKTYYYAIDKDGQGWYYDNPPIFDGEPYMCTSDLTTWIGIDGDWYRVYVPSVVLGWPGILELAETEEELLDYLKDVSEFTRDEKGNN